MRQECGQTRFSFFSIFGFLAGNHFLKGSTRFHSFVLLMFAGSNQGLLKGTYHCTIDLLFDWFGICCMTTDEVLFLFGKQTNPNLSNRSSTVQWYFPLSIPWSNFILWPMHRYLKKSRLLKFVMHRLLALPFPRAFLQQPFTVLKHRYRKSPK
jgi:hypothetical protein